MTVICLELALLILGYRRYVTTPYKVNANPKNAYIGNDSLGIALNKGVYEITLNDSIRFKATHTENSIRETPGFIKDSIRKKAVFLGCSFTYGYGVNDDETFSAQLQKEYPQWKFENHGIIGYGTVQSYMQLNRIVETEQIDAVILTFSSFHFMRNVLSQAYRKNLKLGYAHSSSDVDSLMRGAKFPFVKDTSCEIHYAGWNEIHENWPGRELLASVNWMQTFYEYWIDNELNQLDVTAALILKINQICLERDIDFAVACLDTTEDTKKLEALLPEIRWKNIGFDFSDSSITHLPYDSHPNAAGHLKIATKIKELINQTLANE